MYRIFSGFFILFCLGSCVASRSEDPKELEVKAENEEIEQAKIWYESSLIVEEQPEKVGQLGSWKGTPNWSNYYIYNQNDGKRVIEVQFDWETIMVPDHLNTEGFSRDWVLQIMVLFPQEDGDFAEYLLSIYPDEPGKELNYESFQFGGYYNPPKDFSGIYHFHKSDGRFVSGWRIEDGVRTEQIKSLNKTN